MYRQFDGRHLLGKHRLKRLAIDVILETPPTNIGQVFLVLLIQLGRHLKADGIEQFQKAGEGDGLAIVRSGRCEDAVLEEEPDLPQHSCALASTTAALRS